jgi:lipoyl-dependent peroxiredoxin
MGERKATAEWNGSLMEGGGNIALGSGMFSGAFSFATRMGDEPGTNPEELLGASLAGCYAMALNATLEKKGTPAKNVKAEAKVFLGKDETGFTINRIDLETTASVDGIDQEQFAAIAAEVKNACPISKALAATNITLKATLANAATA